MTVDFNFDWSLLLTRTPWKAYCTPGYSSTLKFELLRIETY